MNSYQKRKATSRMKSGLSGIWLPGRDSNPRPIGYKCPDISARLGLSHHPPSIAEDGCRALVRFIGWGPQPLVSARSCLLIPLGQASLRITIEENGLSSLGFPEFTRFYNPPRGGKLQLGMDLAMAIGTKKLALIEFLPNFIPTSSVTL